MSVRVFILVMDSYLLRSGFAAVLNRIQGVRVMKEFGAGDSFIPYLNSHPVDHIIMGQSEFERYAEFFIARPELLEKTVLIQGSVESEAAPAKTRQDAHTIIDLHEDKDSIIRKIQNLLGLREKPGSGNPAMKLSPRETTILRMVSMGLTNRQIADRLFLSAHTVMTHRKNISSKLGIKSVSGLTIYAIVNNIITIEEASSSAAK